MDPYIEVFGVRLTPTRQQHLLNHKCLVLHVVVGEVFVAGEAGEQPTEALIKEESDVFV